MLWTNIHGPALGWRISSSDTINKAFGPFAGWTAKSLSVGSDDGAHLLWDKTDGTVALWSVDFSSGSFNSPLYGPYAGWSGKAIATGADGVTHILWTHAPDNMASLWSVSSSGTSSHGYGPFAGWSAVAVSAGP